MTREELEQQKKTLETGIAKMQEGLQAVNELLEVEVNKEGKWEWWSPGIGSGEKYYYVDYRGFVMESTSLLRTPVIQGRRFYNVFRSREEAEEFKHLGTYQRKWAMILKELNPPGWKPDWNRQGEEKWFPKWIHNTAVGFGSSDFDSVRVSQWFPPLLYASSRGICEEAMGLMGEGDLKKLLGID